MDQPTLFESKSAEVEKIILYALGDFQSRKKILAERKLPLDRLRGAFKRACEVFGVEELNDDQIADSLEKLGANVKKRPSFVAKHPFWVTVQMELAERSAVFYQNQIKE